MVKRFQLIWLVLLVACLLCGCAAEKKAEETAPKSCAEWADTIAASTGFQELADANAKYLEKHLMVEADSLEDFCLRMDNTRATPEMICVLKVKAGANQAEAKKALEDYRKEQIAVYRDYQPDQVVKLENARVLENGAYLVLSVSHDADKTIAALGSGWK